MNLTIIPGVLDTDTVCKVPTEVINMLPYISTDAIVSVINNFTKNNSSSKDVNVLNAVNKLRAAYRSINELEELLNDTKSKNDKKHKAKNSGQSIGKASYMATTEECDAMQSFMDELERQNESIELD